MRPTKHVFLRPWFTLALMLTSFSAGAQTGAPAPDDPRAAVPALTYRSAVQDYQPAPAHHVAPDQSWLAANHAAHAGGMAGMAGMSTMAPMPAMPAVQAAPHQHEGH